MASKKTKQEPTLKKAKAIVKKINNDLIDASFNAIETTVKTGEKWQKLTAKLIKKTEPLTKKQINMVVETADSIKEQLESGTERLKTLVGYDPKLVEKAKKKIYKHPIVEKTEKIKNKIEKEISNNKLVKKAEKLSDKLKKDISKTVNEVKDKIDNYTTILPKKEEKKSSKPRKKTTKKGTKKKTVSKKAIENKEIIVIEKSDITNDLKIIKGIGPVLEKSLNNIGITAYQQIVNMSVEDLTTALNNANINAKIHDLTNWKLQANAALNPEIKETE